MPVLSYVCFFCFFFRNTLIAACREYDSCPGNELQSPSSKGATNYFNAKWFKQGNLKMTNSSACFMTKSVILVISEESHRETAGIKNFDFKLASTLSLFCSCSFNS